MPLETDYVSILADMEAKRSALDVAISSLRAAISSGALGPTNGLPLEQGGQPSTGIVLGSGRSSGDIPSEAFRGKSMPDAIKAYLSLVRRKQTTREITEALKTGGMESNAKNFIGNVSAVLNRLAKPGGGLLKIQDAWGLADWYPAGFRPTSERKKGTKRKAGRKKNELKKLSKPKTLSGRKRQVDLSAAESTQVKGNLQGKIVALVRKRPMTYQQIAKEAGVKRVQTVALLLGKLVAKGVLEKTNENKFEILGDKHVNLPVR
jgi:hypothetical protein